MNKIFITGATGFIGHKLVQKLLEKQDEGEALELYCLIRDPKKIPAPLLSRITVLKGDHANLHEHRHIIEGCHYIFHVGARSKLGDGVAYQADNVDFTRELVAIAEAATNLKRFVFTSSIGAVDRAVDDDCNRPLSEESLSNPQSDYGRSKRLCEEILQSSMLPYIIVRPTWVYGPGMRNDSHIRVFIEAVIHGKLFTKINFPGNVSLIHVDDLVDALIFLAHHSASVRETYFATDSLRISIGALFKLIGQMTGIKAGMIEVGCGIPLLMRKFRNYFPITVQNLFSDVLCATGEKLASLGYSPRRDHCAGIYETVHWHCQEKERIQGRRVRQAVVTGGASGIGKAVCRLLYAYGYEITIIDRDIQMAQEAAYPLNAQVYAADLSVDAEINQVVQYLQDRAGEIDVLVNNAGVGKRGCFSDSNPQDVWAMMKVNCIAPMLATRAVLESFLQSAQTKTIINVASSAAYQPLPYMAVYAASKASLLSFSDAITGECMRSKGSHVEIISVSPSGTATNFQLSAGVKNEDAGKLLSAEEVASVIFAFIGRGSRSVIIGTSGKGMAVIARLLPKKMQILLWEKLMRALR